jgi:serine O-acetyltransferase
VSLKSDLAKDLKVNASAKGRMATIRAALFNPGFSVVLRYRLARRSMLSGGALHRFLSRLAWLSGVRAFGCYISPSAEIGEGFFLPHPVGIVIGEDVRVGRNVTIYQNVTLGRRNHAETAYPDIGDNVVIYAGAVIVGPVRVGVGAVIAANAVITCDIPAGAVAKGIPGRFA